MMGKAVTQNDIANVLGLSRVTVSKVFNGYGKTSEETKRLVLEKARELGYRWADVTNETITEPDNSLRVAFVCYMRDFNCNFWASIIRGIVKTLSKQKISLGIVLIPEKYEKICKLPSELYAESIDGLIVAGALSYDYFNLLYSLKKPMVSLDMEVKLYNTNRCCDVILSENMDGYYHIVKLLCEAGYTKFAYIGGINCVQSFRERWAGAMFALHECNVPVNSKWIATDGGTYTYYEENAIENIINGYPEAPEVIITFNDNIAARINKMKLNNNCLNITNDTVVVGFDNSLEWASCLENDFNVECYPEEMGEATADTIIWRMKHPNRPFRVIRTRVTTIIPDRFKNTNQAL